MRHLLGLETDIKWSNAIFIVFYHIFGLFWSYKYAFPVKWQTVAFAVVMYLVSAVGVTCGAHRYWTHRSYKATWQLQWILLFCFSCASHTSIRQWARNHRLHHKWSDTDADPHNSQRGLFYSHIGWLMMKKHPEALSKGKTIDISDITEDPLLKWHEKYIFFINPFCCFVLPTVLGVWWWGEAWRTSVAWQCFIRYIYTFHCAFTVNSLAHAYPYKPYNKTLASAENWCVSALTMGEGWHNFHHAFPYDYKAAEYCDTLNLSTSFIKLFHKIGWAYDLKEVDPDSVRSLAQRLGDGTDIKAMEGHYKTC